MGFGSYLKLYLVTIPIFFIIDIVWLGLVAGDFYHNRLGFILSPRVNWGAAMVFYLLYIVGILVFCVRPAIEKNNWKHAAVLGALFGLFTYATYELTNLATLENWPIEVVVVDILWGMCLCTMVALASFFVSRWVA